MYYKDRRSITLRIPASIVGKIRCMVSHFSTEVSWFGDIKRIDDSTIEITDVYLFPQVVTGGTFRTDTKEISDTYDQWYSEKLDEIANHFDETGESLSIMQYNGHSHVQAATNPSTEDLRFRHSRNGLNVYSIHNKKGEASWEVWDNDVVYETEDIEIIYVDSIFAKSKEYVQVPPPVKNYPKHNPASNAWINRYNYNY